MLVEQTFQTNVYDEFFGSNTKMSLFLLYMVKAVLYASLSDPCMRS